MRLLLVEDSARLRDLVSETIHEAGWRIDALPTASDGRIALQSVEYDLVMLDLGLPDEDGLDFLHDMRKAGLTIPILVLTARSAIDERIAGLDAGADDYLTKPFNNGELLARIRALLRRAPIATMPILGFGSLTFDVAKTALSCGAKEIALTPMENSLMQLLMRNAGKVVPKRRIESVLSEFGGERTTNAIELAVSRLRKKLDGLPTDVAVETVRGVGYLLRETSS
jgi:two-component system response regulator QseB/two-component system response regulator TctD